MRITSQTFDENARGALLDQPLQSALRNATKKFVDNRYVAMTQVDDWEDRRQRANAIKRETIDHLDRYLQQFTDNVEKVGGVVHWARNAAEAASHWQMLRTRIPQDFWDELRTANLIHPAAPVPSPAP